MMSPSDPDVHLVAADGAVMDADGEPVEGFELGVGATITEVGRTGMLSALVYRLDDRVADPQPVHDQDEVYVVLSGSATAVVAEESWGVHQGSVLVVPAHTSHRFDDPQDGFVAVAVFAPPLA